MEAYCLEMASPLSAQSKLNHSVGESERETPSRASWCSRAGVEIGVVSLSCDLRGYNKARRIIILPLRANALCTTFVLSKQSMQFVLIKPFCELFTVPC